MTYRHRLVTSEVPRAIRAVKYGRGYYVVFADETNSHRLRSARAAAEYMADWNEHAAEIDAYEAEAQAEREEKVAAYLAQRALRIEAQLKFAF